jgi:hypothetical protein
MRAFVHSIDTVAAIHQPAGLYSVRSPHRSTARFASKHFRPLLSPPTATQPSPGCKEHQQPWHQCGS